MPAVKFSSCLEAALKLESLGLSVIPLRAHEKSPAIAWKEFCNRRATPDEIRDWYTKHPDWNLGIVCGAVSGISVVDIDGEEGVEWFKANGLPVSPLQQRTSGPHKMHMIYRHPGAGFVVHPSVDTTVKVDVRGDGSQIVCAPSIHPNGSRYTLTTKDGYTLETALESLPMMPAMFVESPSDRLYAKPTSQPVQPVVKSSEVVPEGGRNSALTSKCGHWYAKGMDRDEVLALAMHWNAANCTPPLDAKEVEIIVASMANTHGNNNPGLLNTDGVMGWIERANGEFTINDVYRDLCAVDSTDRNKVLMSIKYAVRNGIIETCGKKYGTYRKPSPLAEKIDLFAVEDKPINMWLPFGLHRHCKVMPKNIIAVSGETNSGKTGLMLNIVAMNHSTKFRYLSSEMSPLELRTRLEAFNIPLDQWLSHCDFRQCSSDFADSIAPDDINIIDFLEVNNEFYRVGEYISAIFNKLRNGVAIICTQKRTGEMYGRGGEFGLEKARLAMSLFTHGRLPNGIIGSAIITKCKNIIGNNPEHKEVFYTLRGGMEYSYMPIKSCPTMKVGLHFYNAKEKKALANEIENYCAASAKPSTDMGDSF